jgi:ABC-type transport system substrate-binding protein
LWSGEQLTPLDVLDVKNTLPEVSFYMSGLPSGLADVIFFNTTPVSPFIDVRVRRAFSMAIDRDLYAEAALDLAKFEAAGLPVTARWAGFVGAGWGSYWLDPKGPDLGEGAKYFQHNLEEAKKLMSAAGTPTLNLLQPMAPQNTNQIQLEAVLGMVKEAGFNIELKAVDYQSDFLPTVVQGRGDFDGDLAKLASATLADPAMSLRYQFHSSSPNSYANYKDKEQLEIDGLIVNALSEFDAEAYQAIIHEIQRKMSAWQPAISYGFNATSIAPVWPWVMNWNVFQGAVTRRVSPLETRDGTIHTWYDATKS